jgi:hypothetical protein
MSYYIDLNDARSSLQPRMWVFAGALRRAVEAWNEDGVSKHHTGLTESTRAVFISDLWYQYSSEKLRDDPDVSLETCGTRHFYIIDEKLTLRFKHLNEAYRSWNRRTSRSEAWDLQLPFPTIPPMPRLDLGYRLDITGTVIVAALVVHRRGEEPIWRWQIWGHPISEFASAPRDMLGRGVYSYNDFSGA